MLTSRGQTGNVMAGLDPVKPGHDNGLILC